MLLSHASEGGNEGHPDLPGEGEMKGLPGLALVFSLLFAVFVLGPPLINPPFGPYPLMRTADIVDLFTPVVLIPLYWLLFRLDGTKPPSRVESLSFMVFASVWVLGQGMHLSANSIGHLAEAMEGTDIQELTRLFDETLSHYVWHGGVIALSGLLMYRQWRNRGARSGFFVPALAGIVYGFTFFAMVTEGGTVLLGFPLGILAVVFGVVWGRRQLAKQPVLLFLLTGYAVAVLLFAIWGIWHGGFPEFSEVGLL
jgi:hypothetical protein